MLRTAAALGILLCIAASAQAQEQEQEQAQQETKNLRFGIGVAQYTLDFDDLDIKFKPTGFDAFAGYEFNRYLALEAGYLRAGDDPKNFEGIAKIRVKANAWFASAVVSVPLSNAVSLYGRPGLARFERTATLSGPA
ncbi:MAG TPA: porin family protein, partial [Polyangiaceae bacterium]|nr:porin family protein [Polyangiaceae bacterium]